MPKSIDRKHERKLVALIRKEHRQKTLSAISSLWRIGDAVRRLKRAVGTGASGRAIASCAAQVGLHPDSLDEAARAAEAFRATDRRQLRQRVGQTGIDLTPSHVITLARASPRRRAQGIEALVQRHYTVQELRAYLRELSL